MVRSDEQKLEMGFLVEVMRLSVVGTMVKQYRWRGIVVNEMNL